MKVLNPRDSFVRNWNRIFLLVCLGALAIDAFFFYIPVVDRERYCLNLDKKLEITACVLRTFVDAFHVIRILFQFRTAHIAPSAFAFGRGKLISNPKAIAKRYLCSYFVIDILSVLPIPQVTILAIIPTMKKPAPSVTKKMLKWVIFSQYLPRTVRVYPLFKETTGTYGIETEREWTGAALNLSLYMLASHVFGAFWYLISIEREDKCWRETCEKLPGCSHLNLYCPRVGGGNKRFLESSCPLINPEEITNSTVFNFGMFTDALQSGIVESQHFPKKFLYCFWWGLRNLSTLGQDLKTSDNVGEIIFAIAMCISGLVMFALLIGNMQKYLQSLSTTVRTEEMRVKKRDTEQWMSYRMIPKNLRKRIRRYNRYKWQETRGIEEEALLNSLPKDLRRDTKRHLCLDLLRRVPWFQNMNDWLLDTLLDRLKPVLYTENSYIVREGEPVEDMLLIVRGKLLSTTTNGGKTGFLNSATLKGGDFCGEHLLTWALDPLSSSRLPISSRTIKALTEVEGFVLTADDHKFFASQCRHLHSKELGHMFRFYSLQWRTWAACFIQAAWRRHLRKKLSKALNEEDDRLQKLLQNGSEKDSPNSSANVDSLE